MASGERYAPGSRPIFAFRAFQLRDGKVHDTFGFNFADGLRPDEWECACRVFQKRHLLAHKMGVIDEEYLQKVNDTGAVLARKVRLTEAEVESAIGIVETMGKVRLQLASLPKPT